MPDNNFVMVPDAPSETPRNEVVTRRSERLRYFDIPPVVQWLRRCDGDITLRMQARRVAEYLENEYDRRAKARREHRYAGNCHCPEEDCHCAERDDIERDIKELQERLALLVEREHDHA
jgi:hypothetical protein